MSTVTHRAVAPDVGGALSVTSGVPVLTEEGASADESPSVPSPLQVSGVVARDG